MKRTAAFFLCLVMLLCTTSALGKDGDVIRLYEDQKLIGFVTHCYQTLFNRNPDQQGLNMWVDLLRNGQYSPQGVIQQMIVSEEFMGKNLSDSDFVRIMYQVFLYRTPGDQETDYWVKQIRTGTARDVICQNIGGSEEAQNHYKELYSMNITERLIGKRQYARRLKSEVNPNYLMDDSENPGMLAGILFVEIEDYRQSASATNGFTGWLDIIGDRAAYEAVDQNGRGIAMLPMLENNYYICIWDGENLMSWGTVEDVTVPVLLSMMSRYQEVNAQLLFGVIRALQDHL